MVAFGEIALNHRFHSTDGAIIEEDAPGDSMDPDELVNAASIKNSPAFSATRPHRMNAHIGHHAIARPKRDGPRLLLEGGEELLAWFHDADSGLRVKLPPVLLSEMRLVQNHERS